MPHTSRISGIVFAVAVALAVGACQSGGASPEEVADWPSQQVLRSFPDNGD